MSAICNALSLRVIVLLVICTLIGSWFVWQHKQERTETIFVYATLTNPLVRTFACLCWTPLEPAILTGYRREYRTIVPEPATSTRGGLIQVTARELTQLDRYEGVPHRYNRIQVMVADREVWVYTKITVP